MYKYFTTPSQYLPITVEYDVVVAARIDLVLKEGVEKTADYQLSGHPARESTYQDQGNERKNGRPGPCIDGEVAEACK